MKHEGRGVIRLNDKTDHGGHVISVSSGTVVMGVEAALADDMTFCPKCKETSLLSRMELAPSTMNDPKLASNLRRQIWSQLSDKTFDGGVARQTELASIYKIWVALQNENRSKRQKGEPMLGFLLPIEDNRGTTIRLG